MSAQPAPIPPQDYPAQPADPRGYREVLHDLITMGAGFARLLHGQATAQAQPARPATASAHQDTDPQPAPAALISLSVAFDRTARAVRRGILLARSLDQPVQPAPDPAGNRAAARRQIIRQVEDAIQRTRRGASDESDSPDTLQAELRDRLDAPDLDCDIASRPAADIITEICRDLGLAVPPGSTRPWPRRTPDDIRQLCARAAAPSAPRQPGACQPNICQPSPGPQTLRCDAVPPAPRPQPDNPAPCPRPQPGPIHPGSDPAEDPFETVAMILRHPTRAPSRWRPPPA